jgi:hypothetical protein
VKKNAYSIDLVTEREVGKEPSGSGRSGPYCRAGRLLARKMEKTRRESARGKVNHQDLLTLPSQPYATFFLSITHGENRENGATGGVIATTRRNVGPDHGLVEIASARPLYWVAETSCLPPPRFPAQVVSSSFSKRRAALGVAVVAWAPFFSVYSLPGVTNIPFTLVTSRSGRSTTIDSALSIHEIADRPGSIWSSTTAFF